MSLTECMLPVVFCLPETVLLQCETASDIFFIIIPGINMHNIYVTKADSSAHCEVSKWQVGGWVTFLST